MQQFSCYRIIFTQNTSFITFFLFAYIFLIFFTLFSIKIFSFYYKVIKKVKTPLVLPSIFKKIDQLTIDFFEGKDVREIDKSLPAGRVIFGDRKVRSKPLRPDDSEINFNSRSRSAKLRVAEKIIQQGSS